MGASAGKIAGGGRTASAAPSHGGGDQVAVSTGGRTRLRAPRAGGWTRAKRALFLDHLAATCNVRQSATAAGISAAGCYELKRRDPVFAALWASALEAGYEHIETQLLARAIGSNPAGLGESPDGDDPGALNGDAFDPALALRVLAVRDSRKSRLPSGPASKRGSIEQVRAVLMVKLAALNARLARERIAASAAIGCDADAATALATDVACALVDAQAAPRE